MIKILFLFIMTINISLATYVKKDGLIDPASMIKYSSLEKCGSGCLKLPNMYNPNFHKLFDQMKDDLANPNHELKSDVVLCSSIVDDPETTEIDETKTQMQNCLEKEAAQVCPVSNSIHPYFVVRVADNSEVYCTRIVSYAQIPSGVKEVREDVVLKANYETAKALKDADDIAMNLALKSMNCGRRVKARMLVKNAVKGLNNGQKKQIVTLYKDIQSLLEAGSLDAAKEDIQAVTPDGLLITAGDITALIDEIDGCK